MITIGCDPEFIILKNQRFIKADEIFSENSDLGLDGSPSTGEMRPFPASNSFLLVANIKTLFKKGIEEVPQLKSEKFRFLSGHYKHNKPLGGHIHISSPLLKSSHFSHLHKQLDKILLTLSSIIDDQEEKDQRLASGYGYGWREANHGGLEHRTPGSWLLNPKIAYANLFLAEITTLEFIRKNERIFEKFEEDRDQFSEEESLLKFISNTKIDKEVKNISIRIIENVLENIPHNWNECFKGEWL